MQTLWQDLRYGARMLLKQPGFALLVALILVSVVIVQATFGPLATPAALSLDPASSQQARHSVKTVPPLRLSHCWLVVKTGAPERTALEKASFRIASAVNRHDGQGTASVTVELLNGYVELLYPDPQVPVSPALQAGAEKFRLKSAWRESGYSPLGVVFDRTPVTPQRFPFDTWKISADWMAKGTFIEILTPKEMPKAVSLSISSQAEISSESENAALAKDAVKGARFRHPNGARRLTGLRVVAPSAEVLPPAATYLAELGLLKFDSGSQWLLDVTLDDGKQGVTKNFQPELPMIIHY